MSEIAFLLKIEEERLIPVLQEAVASLKDAKGEVILDFSSVRRIDSGALQAVDDFARVADEKTLTIVLRGVSVDVYKVLKLLKVTQRFSFVN